METSARQLAAMRLIADTFVPAEGALPSASELGSPEVALQLAGQNPRKPERTQLRGLLSAWDSAVAGVATRGRVARFSTLTPGEREAFMLSLAASRVPQKRALFNAFRVASLLTYYVTPGATGHSPAWDAIAYPGPLGRLETAPAPALSPTRVTSDSVLTCDVVVVGSGAGGGTAAGVLAEAGLDVVVLEAGDYFDDADFDGSEMTAFTQFYAAAPQSTVEGSMILMAGSALGGTTVVNYTTSFRTPDDVRAEWATYGARQFESGEYTHSMDAVCERLGVNTDHDLASSRDALMERGLKALGWHCEAMPRNVKGCDMGIECGRCGLGCRIGAKQSTAKTWLADAAAKGARLLVGVRARTVLTDAGRATGVEAFTPEGHRLIVRSRAVVSSTGAIQTPALLKRSGLANRNIGRHLRLHPVTVAWGRFDEAVRPWEGAMQSRFSREHRDMDGDGYGVIYETAPTTPALAAGFLPWLGGAAHRRSMAQLPHLVPLAVIVRDKDSGEVKVGRDGEPRVSYVVSDHDAEHMMRGIGHAARILESAGATEITSCHQAGISYEPGKRGSLRQFALDCERTGVQPGRIATGSLHIMGSARMGGSPATSATNPNGETWDVRGLVVADGSCFPTASGVNPMISIESIAHMNASRLVNRLS